ncbi:hypothetical protein Aduo_001781 [Ancylostoma duodenale]
MIASIINLAVRAALESDAAKIAIYNVKKIVSKMNRSPKVKSLYKRLLKEAGLPPALPVTGCASKWGSTYTMMCDVLNSKLSGSEKRGEAVGECLLSKLRHYFDEWFEDEDLCIAAFCDPRFAFLDTVLPAEIWRATVDKFVASKAKSTECEDTGDLLDRTATVHQTEDEIQIEVQQYAAAEKSESGARIGAHRMVAESLQGVPPHRRISPQIFSCTRNIHRWRAVVQFGLNHIREQKERTFERRTCTVAPDAQVQFQRKSRQVASNEAKKYGRVRPMEEVYEGSTTEEEQSTSEEEKEELL